MLGIHFTLDYYTPANININQLSVLGPVLNLSFGYFVTIIGSRTAELFFFGTCVNKYYIFCFTMIEIANNWQNRSKMPVSIFIFGVFGFGFHNISDLQPIQKYDISLFYRLTMSRKAWAGCKKRGEGRG